MKAFISWSGARSRPKAACRRHQHTPQRAGAPRCACGDAASAGAESPVALCASILLGPVRADG
jgi:hypothetical protein